MPRLEDEDKLPARAEIFRFPAQVASLAEPIRLLVEAMFGESRYEESAWLRGLYLTSATQEGAPIDRLTGGARLVLRPAGRADARRRAGRSSAASSCSRLLTDVIFKEAGLGTFDPLAQRRRAWIWRGAALAAAAVAGARRRWSDGLLLSTTAMRSPRRPAQFEALHAPLAPIAAAAGAGGAAGPSTSALAAMDAVAMPAPTAADAFARPPRAVGRAGAGGGADRHL